MKRNGFFKTIIIIAALIFIVISLLGIKLSGVFNHPKSTLYENWQLVFGFIKSKTAYLFKEYITSPLKDKIIEGISNVFK